MAKREYIEILKQGVGIWNQWRENNPKVRPDLRDADLRQANLKSADLMNAYLERADLSYADLRGADLSGADLKQTNLNRAKLIGANLHRAHLMNANFKSADLSRAILSHASIRGADFTNAYLTRTDLASANLRNACLGGADLSKSDLRGADFSNADLGRATLNGANLRGALVITASLHRSYLIAADLTHALLKDTDMTEARIGGTTFGDMDLSRVISLDKISHRGPSTIGIDTIYRSKGNIPEIFLREAGVPEEFITYMHSLTGLAIEFYSCFISYSSEDQEFAERLRTDLQSKNIRSWFAPEDLKIGDEIRTGIDKSIWTYDKLLLILSRVSVGSQWVQQEVETALAKEREIGRTVLFPIRLDDTIMQIKTGWPALIKNTRNIGDFRKWKSHDSYKRAFDRLIRDLRLEEFDETRV